MGVRYILLVLFVFLNRNIPTTNGAIHQTLTHCCDLGKNYANSDVACGTIRPPFDKVEKKDEGSCLTTLVICCKAQNKENECRLGINDAEVGQCNSASGSERQSCCEACNLGKITSTSGSCENSFSLGSSYDKHFKACCQKHLPRTTTDRNENKDALVEPSLGNLCEIENLCAQICIPTGESYKCDCNPGFTLMADGNGCKEVTGPKTPPNKKSRCDASNPCAHNCVDTGIAIYCTCYDGYELAADKRSCRDINECELEHDCHGNETCVNQEGYYECVEEGDDEDYESFECKPGYRYSWENKICEDINECLLPLTCLPSQKCTNTEGSYNCSGGEVVCPPGYFFKPSTQDCADVDECVTGENECNRESQVCLNNKGSYTCVDKASKKTCPPGFMMNPMLEICVDIDECAQDIPLCAENELCVNEEGGHNCVPIGSAPKPVIPSQPNVTSSTTQNPKTTKTTVKTTTTRTTTKSTTRTTPKTTTTRARTTTKSTTPKPTKPSTMRSSPVFITSTKLTTTRRPFYVPPGFQRPAPPMSCNRGYSYSAVTEQCEDIDECASGENNCDHYQQCYNTLGGYICNCKIGFERDNTTGACQDINECMTNTYDCNEGQRCDNTVGSYLCSRVVSCGTGYTLNYESGVCEDNDECALGTHNCDIGGRNLVCRNTLGSFRCDRPYVPTQPPTPPPPRTPPRQPPVRPYNPNLANNIPLAQPTKPLSYAPIAPVYTPLRPYKPYPPTNPQHNQNPYPNYTIISSQSKKCLPGYYMDGNGACQDIDECLSNPCPRSHHCLNYNGRYECKPKLICTAGFELNPSGEACIDVNECIRGNHTCHASEICRNYHGYYRCECPPGHIKEGKQCVDIDECKFFRGRHCTHGAECVNTIGSFKCQCKEGYKKTNYDDVCEDVDECQEVGRCGSKCHNTLGSYKCYCERGYTLNSDNRTCSDVDECAMFSSQVHCVGTCINSPGSYRCDCPSGYRLGADGHTCQDIDECKSELGDPCKGSDEYCFNTRGSFECASIACPKNYIRDRHQKSRCKLDSESCRHFGECPQHLPDQISYHFFSIVSNYSIPDEPVKLFKMRGPQSPYSRVAFKLDVKSSRAPFNIRPASDSDFWLDRQHNSVTIAIKTSIEGPQQVELTLQMQIFNHNVLTNTVISKILLYVSQFKF